MNGPHDLGGQHGLDPVDPEPETEEPVFHADWERRALGLTLAAGFLGQWNIDKSRYSRETQHPVDYLRQSYYENWLVGLEKLLVENGVIDAEELAKYAPSGETRPDLLERILSAENVENAIAAGGPVDLAIDAAPAFAPGDRVRAKNRHPTGHTREPGYVRNRVGTVHEHYGSHILPDENALGNKVGEHLYSVRFDAAELWGDAGRAGDSVHVDLWESYLEPA